MNEPFRIKDLTAGLPGVTPTVGQHMYEGCVVSLHQQQHTSPSKLYANINGVEHIYDIMWPDVCTQQMERAWRDQEVATEHGAVCISILLALKNTKYTVIERSRKGTGIDYWLGEKDDLLFQKAARLEVSGIFKGDAKDIAKRVEKKRKQTQKSDATSLPVYISVVEFSRPTATFVLK